VTVTATYSGPAGKCAEDKRTVQSRSRYNADGNLAEFIDYGPDGSLHRKDVFTYGASGALQGKASYGSAGLFEKQTFDSKNAGRPITDEMYDYTGSVNGTTTCRFNDKGQPSETQTHDGNGNLIWSQTFNAAGQLIEDDQYQDGALAGERTYIYDANGNILEAAHYDGAGALIDGPKDPARHLYRYDSTGRLVEETMYNADGSIVWKNTHEYDKHGNLTDLRYLYQGAVLRNHRTFDYEYDWAGNWIVRKESEDFSETCSHPMQALFRNITYY
jgi:YD repeat-containing protein